MRAWGEVGFGVLADDYGCEVADHMGFDGGVDGDFVQRLGDIGEGVAGGEDLEARQILLGVLLGAGLLTDMIHLANLLEELDDIFFQRCLITNIAGMTGKSIFGRRVFFQNPLNCILDSVLG